MFPWFQSSKPIAYGPDRYPVYAEDPYAAQHMALHNLLEDGKGISPPQAPRALASLLFASIVRSIWNHRCGRANQNHWGTLKGTQQKLLRRKVELPPTELNHVLHWMAQCGPTHQLPVRALLGNMEKHYSHTKLPAPLQDGLRALLDSRVLDLTRSEDRKLMMRAEQLLCAKPLHKSGLEPEDAWAAFVLEDLEDLPEDVTDSWGAFWNLGSQPDQIHPSQTWFKRARPLLEDIGISPFLTCTPPWLSRAADVLKAGHTDLALSPHNTERLKELLWACGEYKDEALAASLYKLALACFRKAQRNGSRQPRLGHACLETLAKMGVPHGLAHLSELKQRVRYGSAQKLIDKQLQEIARNAQIPLEDLEEIAIPTHDLLHAGYRDTLLGHFTARIRISEDLHTEMSWLRPDGQPQKSVPAQVKRQFPERLAKLQTEHKELQNTLIAQRDRMEHLMVNGKTWAFPVWKERYLDHPLLNQITRSLVWEFSHQGTSRTGTWYKNNLVDLGTRPMHIHPNTTVRVWHPAEAPVAEVSMWKNWLHIHQTRQPFKQIQRKVWTPNDEDLNTLTYTNRYAARFLKQHQLAALCQQRGWKYHLQGVFFDKRDVPSVLFPSQNIKARFHVNPVADKELIADSRICLFVSSGSVSFSQLHNHAQETPVPIHDLPPRLFSEVMRDIALFVEITDQGEDPTWFDHHLPSVRSLEDRRRAFGTLDDHGIQRRTLLQRIIPNLHIASKCQIKEHFLHIDGQRASYKIHLGSGHVLLNPSGQILPLMPDRDKVLAHQMHRPSLSFDQDRILSLILSKALLLANDQNITDPGLLKRLENAAQSA